MDLNEKSMEQEFINGFSSEEALLAKLNILVVGATGSGKSSFINLLFGKTVAKVDAGRPVTQTIDKYELGKITIYDSPGYEAGKQAYFNNEVLEFIDKEKKAENMIHLVLYCISLPSARFTEYDESIIENIQLRKTPVAMILTKVESTSKENSEEMQSTILSKLEIDIFESSNDEKILQELNTIPKINAWVSKNTEEAQKSTFIKESLNTMNEKVKKGLSIIKENSAISVGIGASPIPFSDAPLLIANQITMIGRLASLWDLPSITSIASGSLMTMTVGALGKSLVGNLLKLIPGIGSITGGVINASVASAITYALGYATNLACKKIVEDKINGKVHPIEEYFLNNSFMKTVEQVFFSKKAE